VELAARQPVEAQEWVLGQSVDPRPLAAQSGSGLHFPVWVKSHKLQGKMTLQEEEREFDRS